MAGPRATCSATRHPEIINRAGTSRDQIEFASAASPSNQAVFASSLLVSVIKALAYSSSAIIVSSLLIAAVHSDTVVVREYFRITDAVVNGHNEVWVISHRVTRQGTAAVEIHSRRRRPDDLDVPSSSLPTAGIPTCMAKTQRGLLAGFQDGTLRLVTEDTNDWNVVCFGKHPSWTVEGMTTAVERNRAVTWGGGMASVWNLEDSSLVTQWPTAGLCFVISADGSRLFHDSETSIVERDMETGAQLRDWRLEVGTREISLSPDGRHLAVLTKENQLRMMELHSGRTCWETSTAGGSFGVPDTIVLFSHTGQLVTTGPDDSYENWFIHVWEPTTGRRLNQISVPIRYVVGAAWQSDGTLWTWGTGGICSRSLVGSQVQ